MWPVLRFLGRVTIKVTERYRSVFDALAAAGWTVHVRDAANVLTASDLWPEAIRRRYPNVPQSVVEFLGQLDECVKADETAWFLTAADYAGTSGLAFAWNAWEELELESYAERGDDSSAAQVRAFWDSYLPIYMDVGGDYACFAVRVTEPKVVERKWWMVGGARPVPEPPMGAVVYSAEVDFRGAYEVARSFPEFLAAFVEAVRDPSGPSRLTGLV